MKPDVNEVSIHILARAPQRELIDMAANHVSKSRTDFILEAACREAQDVLLDRSLFLQGGEQFNEFLSALDAPLTQGRQARIEDLMKRKSPWE
ncbi:DUF1778 domain-containing protein [Pluralibacter gergoviae]